MKLVQAVLIGIAIGILIAPDKGSKTLKKLTGKLSDLGEDAEDYLTDATDKLKDKAVGIANGVGSKVKQVGKDIRSKAGDL